VIERKRLAAALRNELRFTDEPSDQFLLDITEGTLLRARVELMLEWEDLKAELRRCLNASLPRGGKGERT